MSSLPDLFHQLTDVRHLVQAGGYVGLTFIIFAETGLLIGFFLPGDSLIVTAGLLAAQPQFGLNIWMLGLLLTVAAIVGNSLGYAIGRFSGPRLFTRDDSLLFKKKHLFRAQEFYQRHGGKTIILAKFVPIIRTFAPVVAGIGKMDRRRFVAFTVVGAVLWVGSMLGIGYALTPLLDPPLKGLFGDDFQTAKHVEKVILLVVLVSVSPMLVAGLRGWAARRKAARAAGAKEVISV
jgi:membrane-associated protein